jgi:hypothetical protein
MDQIHDRVVGLDVHRDSVTACFRVPGPKGGVVREKDRFAMTTTGLEVLASGSLSAASSWWRWRRPATTGTATGTTRSLNQTRGEP